MTEQRDEEFICIEDPRDKLAVMWCDEPQKDGNVMGVQCNRLNPVSFNLDMVKRLRDRLNAIIKINDTE